MEPKIKWCGILDDDATALSTVSVNDCTGLLGYISWLKSEQNGWTKKKAPISAGTTDKTAWNHSTPLNHSYTFIKINYIYITRLAPQLRLDTGEKKLSRITTKSLKR